MAAALFAVHARGRRAAPEIASCGTDAGRPSMPDIAPPEVGQVMATYGIELGSHRAHPLTEAALVGADLVVGMARRHVQESVVLDPSCFRRAFALGELVRRGSAVGPRRAGQEVARWVELAHGDRTRPALAGRDRADDIADPYGGPLTAYRECAETLDRLTGALAALLWPAAER